MTAGNRCRGDRDIAIDDAESSGDCLQQEIPPLIVRSRKFGPVQQCRIEGSLANGIPSI
jgi:hypothetical protein